VAVLNARLSLPLSQTAPLARSLDVPDGAPQPSSFEARFRQAFTERFDGLFRYLDRLSGDPDLAAEIAQETFVRLHQRGEMPDSVGAWLVSVANNLCRDERRRRQRRRRLLASRPPDATMGDGWPTPDGEVVGAERRGMVRAALATLPLRDQQILLLRHTGFSYREIAAGLGLPESSIGTWLARASAAFRAAFLRRHGAPE